MERKYYLCPTNNGYLTVEYQRPPTLGEDPEIIHAYHSYSCRLIIDRSNILRIIPVETHCGYDVPEKAVEYHLGNMKILKAISFTCYGESYGLLLDESKEIWMALPSRISTGSVRKMDFRNIVDIERSNGRVVLFDSSGGISLLEGYRNYGNSFGGRARDIQTKFRKVSCNLVREGLIPIKAALRKVIFSEYCVFLLDEEGNFYAGRYNIDEPGVIAPLRLIYPDAKFIVGCGRRGLIVTKNDLFLEWDFHIEKVSELKLPFKNVKALYHDVEYGKCYLYDGNSLHYSGIPFDFYEAKEWKTLAISENIQITV